MREVTPLGLVVAGFAAVVLDVRIDGFDLAPDALGFVVAAAGLSRLAGRSAWFRAAMVVSILGVLPGLAAQLEEPVGVVLGVETVVHTALVFSVCSGVMEAARSVDRTRSTANLIRWIDLALTVLALPLLVLAAGTSDAGVLVLALVLAGLGIAAWFMIFLLSIRDHPALQSTGGDGPVRRR